MDISHCEDHFTVLIYLTVIFTLDLTENNLERFSYAIVFYTIMKGCQGLLAQPLRY